jgi:hypothetical protein
MLLTLSAAFLMTAAAAPPARLSAADRLAILRLVCEGNLVRDAKDWVCKDPDPADNLMAMRTTELRWGTAFSGRFVAGDAEWLVGLHGLCMQGCVGEAHVVKKTAGRWTVLVRQDDYVHDGCALVRAMSEGFDGMVCPILAGPHQGFMFQALQAYSYVRGKTRTQRLVESEQGGECYAGLEPPATRSRQDELSKPVAGSPESDVAFTVALERRTQACEEESAEPEKVEGRFTLRFLKRGGDVVSDEETARTLREQGWSPEGR